MSSAQCSFDSREVKSIPMEINKTTSILQVTAIACLFKPKENGWLLTNGGINAFEMKPF